MKRFHVSSSKSNEFEIVFKNLLEEYASDVFTVTRMAVKDTADWAVDRLKHKASGAVFDAITTRDFEAENIMKLSNDDTKAFLDVAEPIYQAVLNNSIENLRLAELRDSLLPKLMSGELDVSNIDL